MISEVKNMDCMDYMRQFPDKFFDLAVVDPPYGIDKAFTKTSRIAAYKMGLDFYGCELDKEYFDKMEERFQQECHGVEIINNVTIQQGSLFI